MTTLALRDLSGATGSTPVRETTLWRQLRSHTCTATGSTRCADQHSPRQLAELNCGTKRRCRSVPTSLHCAWNYNHAHSFSELSLRRRARGGSGAVESWTSPQQFCASTAGSGGLDGGARGSRPSKTITPGHSRTSGPTQPTKRSSSAVSQSRLRLGLPHPARRSHRLLTGGSSQVAPGVDAGPARRRNPFTPPSQQAARRPRTGVRRLAGSRMRPLRGAHEYARSRRLNPCLRTLESCHRRIRLMCRSGAPPPPAWRPRR